MPNDLPSIIEQLPASKRTIVEYLKANEPARAEDIADALGVTVSGIRQQLAGLVSEGFVTYEAHRGQPGRPRHLYRLTEHGDGLFPRNYGSLAVEMVQFMGEEDPALLDRLLERRSSRRLERLRPMLEGAPFDERVRLVASMLDTEGFMVRVEETPDGYLIVEQNCSMLDVARADVRLCDSELAFIQQALPGATVTRVRHTLEGDTSCAYLVAPGDAELAAQ